MRAAVAGYRGALSRTVDLGVGGILSCEFGPEGWYADLTFKGQTTGGTYNLGLGALGNPDTGTPKLVFTATSLGFDATGAATTITRTIYGTKQLRKAYPNYLQQEESVVGTTNVKVRIALSDYVFAKDKAGAGNAGTDVVVTVGSGLYTAGGIPSAAGVINATNSSTLAYPKVVGNWSMPPLSPITGSTFDMRAVAFHQSARNGKPVACVKFTATEGANTVTTTVTTPTIDSGFGDAVPVIEYIGTVSSSTLTQGATVTTNFVAYPWVGDAAACLDTTVGGTAQPTPLYGPRSRLCDKSGTYGKSYASVDPVSGNDGTGAVVASGTPTLPYATIAAAYTALRTYNNTNYARNNGGNSTIYLRTGSHTWIGSASVTVGTTPDTWLTVTNFPGDAASGVVIANQTGTTSGSKTLMSMLKVSNVNITQQSANGTFQVGTNGYLWLDQCIINHPTAGQPLFSQSAVAAWYATRCTVTALTQGFRPFSTQNAPCALVRGNTIGAGPAAGTHQVYTTLGNWKNNPTGTSQWNTSITGSLAPLSTNIVFAYNKITLELGTGPVLFFKQSAETETHGIAVIQNLFENTANVSNPLVQICADGSTGSPVENVILWHNTVVGQRANLAYNEVAVTTPAPSDLAYRRLWSMKNNIFEDPNIKADTFAGSGYIASQYKIGTWPLIMGVACSGNLHGELTGIGAAGSFCWEFPGLKCDQPATSMGGAGDLSCTTRALTYPQFVDRKAFDGTTAGAGNGDYHLQTGSPAKALARDWVLPYDLDGNPRSGATEAGTYGGVALVTTGLVSRLVAGQGETVDGSQKLSTWADQTGLGNGASQVTAVNQPTLGSDYLGRPVVKFFTDATTANSDSMDVATGVTFSAQAVSVFMAVRILYGVNSNPFGLLNYAGGSAHMRYVSSNVNTIAQTYQSIGRNTGHAPMLNPTVLSIVSGTGTSVALGQGPDLVTGLTAVTADTDCLGATLGRYNTGGFQAMDVYEVLVYNTALNSTDAAAVRAYLAAKYATRTTAFAKSIVFEGDSITQGTGTIQHRGYPSKVLRSTTADWRQTNIGASGLNLASMSARASATDGYLRSGTRNVLLVQIGRNDLATLTGQQIYDQTVTYVQARVAAGWEVWVGTLLATGGSQSVVEDVNPRLRGTVGNGIVADAGANRIIDFGALPEFDTGPDASNTTYYQGDQTHPTDAGAQLLANLVATQLAP